MIRHATSCLLAALLISLSTSSAAQGAAEIDAKMAALSAQLQLQPRLTQQPMRLAIVPLTNGGGLSPALLDYLVRSLSTQLIQRSQIEIVERQLLSAAIQELKFQRSEAFDKRTVLDLGKLLKATAVLTGSASVIEGVVAVHAVITNVDTGLNMAAGSVHLLRTSRPPPAISADRPLRDPVLGATPAQEFRTHRVEVVRVEERSPGRIALWLRYQPVAGLPAYALLQGSNVCTARMTSSEGQVYRCVASTLPSLSVAPNGLPLSGRPGLIHYEFEGPPASAAARFSFTALQSVVPVLLSHPVGSFERHTVSFTDLVPLTSL
jgi:hypothetical protein